MHHYKKVRSSKMEPANRSGIYTQQESRRKILFLCYRFPYPLIGGDRIKSYHLLKHLSGICDVDLIALNEWDTGSGEALEHVRSFCHSVTVVPFSKNSAWLRVAASLASKLPIEMAWYNVPAMQKAVDVAIASNKYDAVICFFARTAVYVKDLTGIPKILIAEDSRLLADERATKDFSFSTEYLVRRIDAIKLRRYEPETMKKFSVTTFVARPDEERVKAIDPALRTALLTNGVDLSYFDYCNTGREDALLFTGHLKIYHNEMMIRRIVERIYPMIRAERPQTKLWIVGKEPAPAIRKMIEATEGAELFADVEDIRPFYRKAKLFIHPQEVGAGIQNKLLESMAIGCPIITTPVGASGIDGIINGMHVMVSETDEEFVATGLRLLADDNERDWLSRNSRTLIENRYSWDHVFTSFDDIIEGFVPDFFSTSIHHSISRQEAIT